MYTVHYVHYNNAFSLSSMHVKVKKKIQYTFTMLLIWPHHCS